MEGWSLVQRNNRYLNALCYAGEKFLAAVYGPAWHLLEPDYLKIGKWHAIRNRDVQQIHEFQYYWLDPEHSVVSRVAQSVNLTKIAMHFDFDRDLITWHSQMRP